MTITKEAYVDLQEKYGKVMKLIKEVDPEPTPYVSKYLAKQELVCMKAGIEDLLRKCADDKSKEHLRLIGEHINSLLNDPYLFYNSQGC